MISPYKPHPIRTEPPCVARFLTFSCYRRKHLFRHDELATMFIMQLKRQCNRAGIEVWGWVVMPNHIHLMLWAPPDVAIRPVLAIVKRQTSREGLAWLRTHRPDVATGLEHNDALRFWQHGGGYDLPVWSVDKLRSGVEYIHNNPVRAGLVGDPLDYRWSSAREWETGNHAVITTIHWPTV